MQRCKRCSATTVDSRAGRLSRVSLTGGVVTERGVGRFSRMTHDAWATVAAANTKPSSFNRVHRHSLALSASLCCTMYTVSLSLSASREFSQWTET